jgi:hypothetical protein
MLRQAEAYPIPLLQLPKGMQRAQQSLCHERPKSVHKGALLPPNTAKYNTYFRSLKWLFARLVLGSVGPHLAKDNGGVQGSQMCLSLYTE